MPEDEISNRDPVCGQLITAAGDQFQSEYADVVYRFCSRDCMDRFEEQPDIFTVKPGLGQQAEHDRAQRADDQQGEVQPRQPVRLDSNLPAADPG